MGMGWKIGVAALGLAVCGLLGEVALLVAERKPTPRGAATQPATQILVPTPGPITPSLAPSPSTAPRTVRSTPTAAPTPTRASPTITVPTTLASIPAGGTRVIGYSVEGRPLTVYRFGHGPRQYMLVAGIHGGYEWNTVLLAERLLDVLQRGEISVPDEVTLFLLPNLNPDGYARGKGYQGRANARGVDLNRNFPWNWTVDWNRSACWNYAPITAGSAPLSEPETQALAAFLQRPDVRLQALISYHSAALGIFPAGWPHEPHPPSVALARTLASATGYRYPPQDYGCQLTGQLVDWVAFDLGIPAVDIELTNHHDPDLQQNLAALRQLLIWTPAPTATPTPASIR